MRIWFDITNAPHVNFFLDLIQELESDHEVVITCRPLSNTIDLLDLYQLPYTVVGKHYGASKVKKVLGFFQRIFQLRSFLVKNKPDVAISHSSFYSPLVARMLGVPAIYMNDNEHALGNVPAFLFATEILIPEFLKKESVQKQGAKASKIVQYPGVKEGIYLWNLELPQESSNNRPKIYVRPEPWAAQYYTGGTNFMDELLLGLQEKAEVILLPRGDEQAVHYRGEAFSSVTIPDKPLTLTEILADCALFIGAGGTMTRELAVLGVPTISIYQAELLDVDTYLLEQGCMSHMPSVTAPQALAFLDQATRSEPNRALLEKGRSAYTLVKSHLLALAK